MSEKTVTNTFRGLVVAMFSIILAMTGYIVHTISNGIDDANHRIDMVVFRVNDIDHRLVAAETRISDMKGH